MCATAEKNPFYFISSCVFMRCRFFNSFTVNMRLHRNLSASEWVSGDWGEGRGGGVLVGMGPEPIEHSVSICTSMARWTRHTHSHLPGTRKAMRTRSVNSFPIKNANHFAHVRMVMHFFRLIGGELSAITSTLSGCHCVFLLLLFATFSWGFSFDSRVANSVCCRLQAYRCSAVRYGRRWIPMATDVMQCNVSLHRSSVHEAWSISEKKERKKELVRKTLYQNRYFIEEDVRLIESFKCITKIVVRLHK